MIKLYHGDFLEQAKSIPDDSVDLVLTDPPYGTVKNMRLGHQAENVYGWDEAIETKVLFKEINRILRKNGKAVLFGQEPFTSRMITEAIPNLPFSYRMIWEKDHFANALGAKKAPVNYYEDVMVFSKVHPKHDFEGRHPLRDYFSGVLDFISIPKSKIIKEVGQRAVNVFRVNTTQFAICTEETYEELINRYEIEKMPGFRQYKDLKHTDVEYRQRLIDDMNERHPSVFNIWEEEPVSDFEDILIFNKVHPTGTEIMAHPLREYFGLILKHIGTPYNHINERLGHRKAEHSFYVDNTQFKLCTKEVYEQLVQAYSLEDMKGYKAYNELKKIDTHYKKQVASTFNLWQKKKSKTNILKYAKDHPSLHPTMKPILLLEDLIKTFSNEGDLVVDLTMGSGSTGVACKNTGRSFIGIEMDENYFNVAKKRITET